MNANPSEMPPALELTVASAIRPRRTRPRLVRVIAYPTVVPITAPRTELTIDSTNEFQMERWNVTFVNTFPMLRAHSIAIEVVSDGFGFFVGPSLERAGVGDVPVFTARTWFPPKRVAIAFPDGHPSCSVCGTCKRERILLHQRAGRFVVFIGDGFSDLYAASHADLVFAKDHLALLCLDRGLPFRPWEDFAQIQDALSELISNGVPSPRPRPFVCGPEVWPPGTTEPLWDRAPAPRAESDGVGSA